MENFVIQKINNKNECIVLSTSYVSPLDEIFELEEKLEEIKFKGNIIIDLLLCNGLTNRFFKTFFDGEFIDFNSIKADEEVELEVKKISRNFYMKNLELVDDSILPEAHKYIVKNGLI